jgi:hypothetical protein
VLSYRTVSGRCAAGIGSLVIVNDEGWALTAGHIIEQCDQLASGHAALTKYETDMAAINADRSLGAQEREKRISALGPQSPNAIRNFFFWWGRDGVELADVTVVDDFDLAVGRLVPFDPSSIATYPVLKDPAKGVDPGTSLARWAFRFTRSSRPGKRTGRHSCCRPAPCRCRCSR